ncbi:hypothetical protein OESDEN_20582 [Oesophagostomum dentatum]|uniref:Uncharacterized protein n=1 Tax=Oesophagostomum dentatum TaxID=61180 RepID=A0A0B1S787_OESDE|nr:hypothetical protein OESDEN_20582 [Oesophagostomum dentatum]
MQSLTRNNMCGPTRSSRTFSTVRWCRKTALPMYLLLGADHLTFTSTRTFWRINLLATSGMWS